VRPKIKLKLIPLCADKVIRGIILMTLCKEIKIELATSITFWAIINLSLFVFI
jgi:hypothetical protein